jgi:hypothetical protein
LPAQVVAGVGQPPAGELERRIGAQDVEVVCIFIAAADREDAGPDHAGLFSSADIEGRLGIPGGENV